MQLSGFGRSGDGPTPFKGADRFISEMKFVAQVLGITGRIEGEPDLGTPRAGREKYL
jgi:hypothetical protein